MTPEEKRILDRFDVVLLPLRSFIEIIEEGSNEHQNMASVLTAVEKELYHSLKDFIDEGHKIQAAAQRGE